MCCQNSKESIANTMMKEIVLFLISILICSSVWADVTFIDGPVSPYNLEHTPWGAIGGNIMDGVLEAGTYRILVDYRNDVVIDSTTPIYNEISYDIDGDSSTALSYTGSEVGLCYAEAYADVSQEDISQVPGNYAQASSVTRGYANFYIDSDTLSLQWEYEPYEFATLPIYLWLIEIYDQYTGTPIFYAYSGYGDPMSGTQQITLEPYKDYVLIWGVNSEAINDSIGSFDTKGWGKLTLNLEDISSPVPVPGAILLGILGLGTAGIKLRKKSV